jgi:GNAT superfamily N-acetyltransferase
VVIAYDQDQPIAFALYHYNYSTFKGKKGLYLEDLFVKEAHRGKGVGNQLFDYLRKKAKDENCGRMEWVCLDWNQNAIDFYRQKEAVSMDGWTIFRIDEKNL